MPGVALDAARPCRAGASGPHRPGHARRACRRVLRARSGPGVAPRGRDRRDLGDGRREPAAGRRRGVDGAGPAGGADRRSAARAARAGRAPDDRPGRDLRRRRCAGRSTCRCSMARRRRRRHVRSVVGRAVAVASGSPAGPVHLNIPFREPLDPDCAALGPLPADGSDERPPGRPTPRRSPGGPRSRPTPSRTWPPAWPRPRAGSSSPARRTTRPCRRRSPASPPRPAFRSSRIRSRRPLRVRTIAATSWRTRTTSSGPDRGATRTCPTSSSASARPRPRSRC